MLDVYYMIERPFNGCATDVAREIGLLEHQAEVDYVLAKYFIKDGDKWTHERCEKEISVYKSKQESASRAGKASAKARKQAASERTFNDKSTDVQPTNNQEPINNKQETTKRKRFTPPLFDEVSAYCKTRNNQVDPQAFLDHYQSNGWMRGKNKIKDWQACVRTWEKNHETSQRTYGKAVSKSDQRDEEARRYLAKIDAGDVEGATGFEISS